MRYLMMIAGDESDLTGLSPEDAAAVTAEYGVWVEEMAGKGKLQGGERLQWVADATTVRVRDGEVLTIDGPFAETKEQIGGYFLVDAIEAAAKLPGALTGSIEVRPIWEM